MRRLLHQKISPPELLAEWSRERAMMARIEKIIVGETVQSSTAEASATRRMMSAEHAARTPKNRHNAGRYGNRLEVSAVHGAPCVACDFAES